MTTRITVRSGSPTARSTATIFGPKKRPLARRSMTGSSKPNPGRTPGSSARGTTGWLPMEPWSAATNGRCASLTRGIAPERILDFEITLFASNGPLTFGDTKEGTMAVRLAETMRLNGQVGHGHIVNSAGVRDDATWGKRADWCDYYGPVAANGRHCHFRSPGQSPASHLVARAGLRTFRRQRLRPHDFEIARQNTPGTSPCPRARA